VSKLSDVTWLRLIHKKYSSLSLSSLSPEQTHLSRNLSCSVLSLLLHMDGVAQHSSLLTTREPCPGSCSCTDACCASVAQCGEPWAGVALRACVRATACHGAAMNARPRRRHGLSLRADRCGSSLAALPPQACIGRARACGQRSESPP
jgi:hypothetical protein